MIIGEPYQSAGSDWIVVFGGDKYRFETRGAAYLWRETMDKKLELAETIIGDVQTLVSVMDSGPDTLQWYFDSGYTYTDDDLIELGITAAQLVSCLTLLENVGKFFSGGGPANAVYRVTVNAVR